MNSAIEKLKAYKLHNPDAALTPVELAACEIVAKTADKNGSVHGWRDDQNRCGFFGHTMCNYDNEMKSPDWRRAVTQFAAVIAARDAMEAWGWGRTYPVAGSKDACHSLGLDPLIDWPRIEAELARAETPAETPAEVPASWRPVNDSPLTEPEVEAWREWHARQGWLLPRDTPTWDRGYYAAHRKCDAPFRAALKAADDKETAEKQAASAALGSGTLPAIDYTPTRIEVWAAPPAPPTPEPRVAVAFSDGSRASLTMQEQDRILHGHDGEAHAFIEAVIFAKHGPTPTQPHGQTPIDVPVKRPAPITGRSAHVPKLGPWWGNADD